MSSATSSRHPRYSVIIVTYNSLGNIRVCLDSLRRCGKVASEAEAGGSTEIIVVDNNSRDGTGAYLSFQGDIRALLNAGNNGFSKACNQGAAIAKGDFVVFLNPDTLVTPGWIDTMASHFRDPSVGAVGPVSNYVAGLQRLDMNLPPAWRDAKSFPGDGAAEVAGNLARILKEGNSGKGVATKLLIGFCLMMERTLYESMGGMDEDLFLGNDDLDLSWRLRNMGRKLIVASDAFVFHEGQKSFQTEAKTVVDRLTQESTDALYVKLVRHYGGRDKVPSAAELWDIGWFSPSPSLLAGPLPLKGGNMNPLRELKPKSAAETAAKAEAREHDSWKSVTAILYLGPDADLAAGDPSLPSGAALRLERTLATLPDLPGLEIIVLNCSGAAGLSPEAPAGANLRKLDLGPGFPAKQALEIAVAMLSGTHALFCLAGVEFSALFNHWLDRHDLASLGAWSPLPLRIGDGAPAAREGAEKSRSPFAFLGRKEWFREILGSLASGDTAAFLASLGDRLSRDIPSSTGKPADPPWLSARASDLPAEGRGQAPAGRSATASPAPSPASAPAKVSAGLLDALNHMGRKEKAQSAPAAEPARAETAKAGDPIALYPESLRAAMRQAGNIGFAGTNAQAPAVTGPIKVFNLKGDLVPLSAQDLIILRITPDLIEGLPERLANLRKQATGLKRLVIVCNGSQAKGIPATSPLAPVDLTAEGIRAALWRAGFAVASERPYVGFPDTALQSENLRGWFQVEAVPRTTAHAAGKLVSIIILGFNQVEYTRKCIESIRKYTRQKYELILIDNGSKDGTEAFFRSIPGAKVVRNPENLGVAKGWNQGMRLAEGEYLLILNNDIIVGPDWLENMVRLAESDPSIGLVGPRSNYIAGPQVVPNVPYKAEGGIQDFIREWQEGHVLSASEFAFIKGFCHLIPRRVFAKVGFYDERYGKGNFEDDDYCMRVRYHGFRALFADDSFIHHYGSVSFNQESVDWRALMIENQGKYERKWAKGAAAVNDTMVAEPAAEPASRKLEEGRLAYEKGDMRTARARFMEAQAADPADPEPYCSLGALMFSEGAFPEAVSFLMGCLNLAPAHTDAARNLLETLSAQNGAISLEEATALASRYPSNPVLREARADLARAAAADRGEAAGSPEPRNWSPALPAWRTEVEACIGAANYSAAMDILEVRMKSGEMPGAVYNYMGIIAHACGDAEMTLQHFTAALKHAPGDADILFNMSDTLLAMGRPAEAAKLLEDSARKTGVESDPDLPDLAATAEQIRHAMAKGKIDAAVLLASRDANQQAERLLREGAADESMAFLDAALDSDPEDFRALNNLGLMAWYKDSGQDAWECFSACLAIRPTWADALINAFDTALALGQADAVRPLLDAALAAQPGHVQALAMQGHIRSQGPAISGFKSFEELEANAVRLGKAEAALEQAKQGEAILIFLEALKQRPGNPQAYNGLGIIAFGEKRFPDAFGLFEAAAALHPLDQDILMNLWQCAKALRRQNEVLPKLKTLLERNPALGEVEAAIREFA